MPDKIEQINNIIDDLKEIDVSDLKSMSGISEFFADLDTIKSLLDGCSDNSQVVIAYDRSQLNDYIWSATNKTYKCTDEEWEQAWNHIHNDDTAWGYMSDVCYEAEGNLLDKLEDEGEQEDSAEYPTHHTLGKTLRKDSDE